MDAEGDVDGDSLGLGSLCQRGDALDQGRHSGLLEEELGFMAQSARVRVAIPVASDISRMQYLSRNGMFTSDLQGVSSIFQTDNISVPLHSSFRGPRSQSIMNITMSAMAGIEAHFACAVAVPP